MTAMHKLRSGKWKVDEVADRLDQAINTLKKLPPVRVQGYRCYWPDVIYSAAEAYGWEPARRVRSLPSSREIDEMDEALRWLMWLNRYEVKLIVLRAFGRKWKQIGYELGWSVRKLQVDWQVALFKVLQNLNTPCTKKRLPYQRMLQNAQTRI